MSQVREVRLPVDMITFAEKALRGVDRNTPEYQEFASSIKSKGVITPIVVRPLPADQRKEGGPEYVVIDGLQRLSAAKDSGLPDIPVRITDMTDKQVRDAQIIANAHRIETKKKEYADALQGILNDNPMMTHAELANQLNKSESWLDNMLNLTRLTPEVGEVVNENKVTLQNAVALSKLPKEEQGDFLQHAMTMDPGTFGAHVQEHLKAVRKARREGRPVGPAEYVANPVLRTRAELEAAANDSQFITGLLRTEGIKTNQDTVMAATVAVQWALNLNPTRIAERKVEHENQVAEREAQKLRDKEARETKKAADATEARKRLEAELATA